MSVFVPKYHLVRIELKPNNQNPIDVCERIARLKGVEEIHPNGGTLLAKVYGNRQEIIDVLKKTEPVSSICVVGSFY